MTKQMEERAGYEKRIDKRSRKELDEETAKLQASYREFARGHRRAFGSGHVLLESEEVWDWTIRAFADILKIAPKMVVHAIHARIPAVYTEAELDDFEYQLSALFDVVHIVDRIMKSVRDKDHDSYDEALRELERELKDDVSWFHEGVDEERLEREMRDPKLQGPPPKEYTPAPREELENMARNIMGVKDAE